MPEKVVITLKEGPVRIQRIGSSGLDNTFCLWDDIKAREFFPKNEIATYELSIFKEAIHHTEVTEIEQALIGALQQLCYVWPFASGTRLKSHRISMQSTHEFTSNADSVRQSLLDKAGILTGVATMSFSATICGDLIQAPLSLAVSLCKHAQADPYFMNMMRYHYLTVSELPDWYVHLYKVRDVLCDAIGAHPNAPSKKRKLVKFIQSKFSISNSEWELFGKSLNYGYDFRHPPRGSQTAMVMSDTVKSRLIQLGYDWIVRYGRYKGYIV